MRPVEMTARAAAASRALLALALCLAAAPASADGELAFSAVQGHGGVLLNVVEAGNRKGPPILFIHGFSQSYLSWEEQLADPKLNTRYHLVAVDLRGHGASGKPVDPAAYGSIAPWADDLAAVIRAKKLERPVLVGWSFGGAVVMAYVARYGSTALAGIDFVGTTAAIRSNGVRPAPPSPSMQAAIAAMTSPDIAANLAATDRFIAGLTAVPLTGERRARMLASNMMTPYYARRASGALSFDATPFARKTRIPVLFTVGAHDSFLPLQTAQAAQHAFPKSSLSYYTDSGHMPFIEAPARFNDELDRFAAAAQ